MKTTVRRDQSVDTFTLAMFRFDKFHKKFTIFKTAQSLNSLLKCIHKWAPFPFNNINWIVLISMQLTNRCDTGIERSICQLKQLYSCVEYINRSFDLFVIRSVSKSSINMKCELIIIKMASTHNEIKRTTLFSIIDMIRLKQYELLVGFISYFSTVFYVIWWWIACVFQRIQSIAKLIL